MNIVKSFQVLTLIALTANVSAQTETIATNEQTIESSASKSLQSRQYELELSAARRELTFDSGFGESIVNGGGLDLGASKMFHLGNMLTASTGVKGNISVMQDDVEFTAFERDYRSFDVSLVQKFALNINMGNNTFLRPFVEGSAGFGQLRREEQGAFAGSSFETTTRTNYRIYGGAIGVQLALLNSNIIPFAKFDYRKIRLTDSSNVSGTRDGVDVDTNLSNTGAADTDVTVTAITAGLNFMF